MVTNKIPCQCFKITGVVCGWEGPREETVVVEFMPKHLRDQHQTAGNSGVYPCNGAERYRVEESCAKEIVDNEGGWASIV